LLGLLFYDPPKANIQEIIKQFYEAGMDLKVTLETIVTTTALQKKQH
jgi:Ca2+-transporting ATPase